ncbi:MAG TPA: Rieske (2Fe-2S) protein, partial [Nocardioidaceae bacterium]|nr:Rieske (2Fe-2S) protein [Nocardioidaceae bacterium]
MPDRSPDPSAPDVSRRIVLRGAALGGVALPLLAACGGDPETGDASVGGSGPSGSGGAGGARSLGSTGDVPVGGGEVLPDAQVVLTQPTEGDFKAFTAVCTHMQCLVNSVSDGVIHCPCHGSEYSIEDGSVLGGPAPEPLAEIAITVKGDR